jgi:hypothetical protein
VIISKHFLITEFVTYHDHKFILDDSILYNSQDVSELMKVTDLKSPTNLDYEFIKPFKQKITSWDDYNIEDFMEDPKDIRYKKVMSWID